MNHALLSTECLTGRVVEDLPRCSCEEFAAAMGLQNAATAKDLLDKLAAYYRRSRTPSIPDAIVEMADRYCCDPYVVWLWSLDPDFRLEAEVVSYLLHVMLEFCIEVPTKSMEDLVKECINDRDLYDVARLRVMQARGCPVVAPRLFRVFS